jgi:hypothetical protein
MVLLDKKLVILTDIFFLKIILDWIFGCGYAYDHLLPVARGLLFDDLDLNNI